jgi:hypothetical protein
MNRVARYLDCLSRFTRLILGKSKHKQEIWSGDVLNTIGMLKANSPRWLSAAMVKILSY